MCASLASSTPLLATSGDVLVLEPGVPIYVGAGEPEPVRLAARDLARDLRQVLGKESPIVTDRSESRGRPSIEIIGPGADAEGQRDAKSEIAGREAHGVFVARDDRGDRVVLQGTDTRGAIFAIYTFSENFLGVKPLWFWASQPPPECESVGVPVDTDLRFDSPYVKWRAWFPNDTDLFTPWRNKSQENYDAIYEAMLRLKLNCLEGVVTDGDSFEPPYPLGRLAETARQRGLAFVGHHINPLGASYRTWEDFWRKVEGRDPPPLSVENVEALETFWRWHAELARRHDLEQIWLVGFRGIGDRPFWTDFEDSPSSEKERAAVIEEMMKRQVAIVKEATGEVAPVMRTTLYNELSDLYAKGMLRPLPEPNLIWTFVAARRDHYPAPDAQEANIPPNQPVGYYFNFQFTSTGAHLAPAEGPWKMERNYRFIDGIEPRPLEFAVVNMGNIREFVLEGAANAAMMFDFEHYDSDRFLLDFCRTYFGEEHATQVAKLYHDYFHAFWQQRQPTMPGFDRQYVFQDLRLNRAINQLLRVLEEPDGNARARLLEDDGPAADQSWFNIRPADSGASGRLEAFLSGTRDSERKFRGVAERGEALMPDLPEESRTFFQDSLLVPARFLRATNAAAHHLALAVRASSDEVRSRELALAGTYVAEMEASLEPAEHGVFESWYEGNRIFDLKGHKQAVERLAP